MFHRIAAGMPNPDRAAWLTRFRQLARSFGLDRFTHSLCSRRATKPAAKERAMVVDDVLGKMIEAFGAIRIDGVLEHVAEACEVEADAAECDADGVTWLAVAEHLRGKAQEIEQLYEDTGRRRSGIQPQ